MLHKQKIIIYVLIILLLLSSNVFATSKSNINNKVYIVILNRITIEDIQSMEYLKSLVPMGSFGLMNTRGLQGYDGAESYITINSSTRAAANYTTSMFFNVSVNKKISEIYKRRTGNIVEKFNIVNIEINKLIKLNDDNKYMPYIGALGDNLRSNGYKTAVFGNSDTCDSIIRPNCLIAVDHNGIIDYGNVDNILIEDDTYPYGLKTDYSRILKEISLIKDANLIVIETGDLNRLNSYSNNLTDEMFRHHRNKILKDIDIFIENLANNIDLNNSRIFFISPNAGDSRLNDRSRLTPILVLGDDVSQGILTSKSTRRQGIISNIDIAPSITSYLKAPNYNFNGNEISFIKTENNLNFIKQLNNITNFVSNIRYKFLSLYNIIVILGIIIITVCLLLRSKCNNLPLKIVDYILLLILVTPFIFIIIPTFKISNIFNYVLLSISLLALIAYLLYKLKLEYKILTIIGLTFFALLFDVFTGSNLIRYSVLGYDPIIGARYYGIGNELAGVLIPSLFILSGFYLNKFNKRKYVLILLFLLTIYSISHPNLGANLGGTISLIFSALYFALKVLNIKLNVKKFIIIGFTIGFIVIIISFLDMTFNNTPSHLGKTLQLVMENGLENITNILFRKVEMNIKLIGNTIWTRLLYIEIISLIILFTYFKSNILYLFNKYKYFDITFSSCILGSIAGFLVNDSGVLLASISNIFITATLLYFILKKTLKNTT